MLSRVAKFIRHQLPSLNKLQEKARRDSLFRKKYISTPARKALTFILDNYFSVSVTTGFVVFVLLYNAKERARQKELLARLDVVIQNLSEET